MLDKEQTSVPTGCSDPEDDPDPRSCTALSAEPLAGDLGIGWREWCSGARGLAIDVVVSAKSEVCEITASRLLDQMRLHISTWEIGCHYRLNA